MTERATRVPRRLAVVGAGNMGAGIAQKMASEGFDVTLVDLDDDKVGRGVAGVRRTLEQGVERRIFRAEQVHAILGRIHGTADWERLVDADLVVEAVFEDLDVKRGVFRRLDDVCRSDALLGTNTSSFLVRDVAAATRRPERVLGLHYFYHPAKNRLVEVVAAEATAPDAIAAAWTVQERIGKTPIRSADASGFVVNRYFVPWLNEAVRLLAEEVADLPTIEHASKETFGIGMGPFELMNVTGIPIALHAATTLGTRFGPLYAPAPRLVAQVASGESWPLDGAPDPSRAPAVADRMLAIVFHVAATLVDEGVGTIEDTDIGARVGLRWPRGPFEMMNRLGVDRAAVLARSVAERWNVAVPEMLAERAAARTPFRFRLVTREDRDGIATLTINRPDAMNALNEDVVAQLRRELDAAAADRSVRGIVLAGAGKAFVAGADIRFFVRNIEAGDLDRIVSFTETGHALLDAIDRCPKPVVARVHGPAIGGGLELALACDAIVASPKAAFAFPETGIGIYPGLGGTQRAPRRLGPNLAKALIFTGRTLGADDALAIGLVDAVVPHEEIDAHVRQLAARGISQRVRPTPPAAWAALERFFAEHDAASIVAGRADTTSDERLQKAAQQVATKAPLALRAAEELIDAGDGRSLEDGLRLELARLREIFATADALEGLSSLGRRRPEFKGR